MLCSSNCRTACSRRSQAASNTAALFASHSQFVRRASDMSFEIALGKSAGELLDRLDRRQDALEILMRHGAGSFRQVMATCHPLPLSIRIRSPGSDAASGYASNVCRRALDIPQFHTDGQHDSESNAREHTPVGSIHPAHSSTVRWCLLLLLGNLRHERLGREQERGDRRRVLKPGPHHLGRVDDAPASFTVQRRTGPRAPAR